MTWALMCLIQVRSALGQPTWPPPTAPAPRGSACTLRGVSCCYINTSLVLAMSIYLCNSIWTRTQDTESCCGHWLSHRAFHSRLMTLTIQDLIWWMLQVINIVKLNYFWWNNSKHSWFPPMVRGTHEAYTSLDVWYSCIYSAIWQTQ